MVLLLGILFTLLVTSQASEDDLKNLARANNEFSLKIYKTLPSTGNFFYSPASIFTALGMLYKGAEGGTAEEIRKALSYETAGLKDESVHQNFKDLLDSFEMASDEYELLIANAIVASSHPISEEYKEALKTYYNAMVKYVNFQVQETALDEINGWVKEKTQGKILQLLNDIDKDTVMVLLNAVYFKGTWQTPFDENSTEDGIFYSNGNDPNSVKMMNVESKFHYDESPEDKFQVLKLPYKGEDVSMVILLPFERDGLKDLEGILTSQKLTEIISNVSGRKTELKVFIPKFQLEDSRRLVENLQQLDMQSAFQEGIANFNGMDENSHFFISNIVHKAVIEVNEEGSEAGSTTGAAASIRSTGDIFKADHPFLFFIRDERTDMTLFMGRVNHV